MRQRGGFRHRSDLGQPLRAGDVVLRLQQLMTMSGAGTREALWAVQLMERKAAVARWRSGESSRTRRPHGTGMRRA